MCREICVAGFAFNFFFFRSMALAPDCVVVIRGKAANGELRGCTRMSGSIASAIVLCSLQKLVRY
jgi:hypothetical protein